MPMLSWCLNGVYLLVLTLASPWLLYRRFTRKKPVAGLRMKLTGRIARPQPDRPCVWFHAVSVGEVLQLPTLIADFVATLDGHETAARTARKAFPAAEKAGDQPTMDLLTQRMEDHEKTAWMLRSLLEK